VRLSGHPTKLDRVERVTGAVVHGDRALSRGVLAEDGAQRGREERLAGLVALAALGQLAGCDWDGRLDLLGQAFHLVRLPAAAVAPQNERVALGGALLCRPANEVDQRLGCA
jgi:hypothetical protein